MNVLFDGVNFILLKSFQFSDDSVYSIRCIFSAAITAYLARGIHIKQAVEDAITYTGTVLQHSSSFIGNSDQLKHIVSVISTDNNVVQGKDRLEIEKPHLSLQQPSFVQLLKTECAREWFDYTHHQFILELASGTLSQESFKHYLIQDYIFLTHFARCYALAAYKSNSMAEILLAAKNACSIGHESELHVKYCAEWGIDATSLHSFREARANLAYTRYTLDIGMTGDLLDLYVALSACLLGYGEIGLRLFEDPKTNHNSSYWKWILSYAADDYQQGCREGEQMIEQLVNDYGIWHAPNRIKKLVNIFKTATLLEIEFWNMGLNIEW
ncbi:hypothetical protein I4U23_019968 [Adineta vaga]|nr:hypothetical protein I4U23_019968 [Adineta vaga]